MRNSECGITWKIISIRKTEVRARCVRLDSAFRIARSEFAMTHFADRLAAAIRAKSTPLCVGLDPRWELLPASIRQRHAGNIAAAYEEFCFRVLDIVAPLVAVVKPQSAFFEAAGPAGMMALQQVIRKAKRL